MKIYTSISIIIIACCFSGCYSSRLYNYELSDANKAVVKRVFTSGVVSCTDGYCWRIDSERSQSGLYTIDGSRVLFMAIKLKANEKNSDAFKVKLRVTNLGLRYRKVEKPFLNELEGALFNANEGTIKKKITEILKDASEKSKKKRQ